MPPGIKVHTCVVDLIQLLRRHRYPVAGPPAQELGVSLRTIYRDIETLSGHGARSDGELGRLRALAGLHAAALDVLRGRDRSAGAWFAIGCTA